MIGVLLATRMEAEPLLETLRAEEMASAPFAAFTFAPSSVRPGGVIVISGMGKAAAVAAAEYLIATKGAHFILNLGICGALAKGLTVGQIFRVTQTRDGDDTSAPPVFLDGFAGIRLPKATLVTSAEPVFGGERNARMLEFGELADMEGDAVARVCARHGVKCLMLKGVSDFANHAGREDLHRNLQAVSALVAKTAGETLEWMARNPLPTDLPPLPPLVKGGRTETAPVSENGKDNGDPFLPNIKQSTLPTEAVLPPLPRGGRRGAVLPRLAHFIKFEHSVFSLPLLLTGAWIGAGMRLPSWRVLGLIALAGVGARTFGMAANRIFDRELDALNPRTTARELPRGGITLAQAWTVALSGLAAYLLACAGLGKLCLLLSPLPALPLLGYSLLKRFTCLCHFGIGFCQALGPPAAFVAASGTVVFDSRVALLALFTFLWMSGFDIIYALLDVASDRQTGVHSLPVALGPKGAQAVAALLHAGAAAAIVWLWRMTGGGILSGATLVIALGALCAGNLPWLSPAFRFFPLSAVASISGALLPILGGLP
jgi:4-hydroxybenzoate polyprenyltransferase